MRRCLDAVHSGQGGVILISGESGIGKTALAEYLRTEAKARGFRSATAYCNTFSPRLPYAPWEDLCRGLSQIAGVAAPSDIHTRDRDNEHVWEAAFVMRLRAFLEAHAAMGPVVLVIDDLHCASDATLRVLQTLARSIVALPIIVVGTYQPVEVPPDGVLGRLLAFLLRDAQTIAITPQPLSARDVHALTLSRYRLSDDDAGRLMAFVSPRAEGNPLFVTEYLKSLEAQGVLAETGVEWSLGDLRMVEIPTSLQLMIHNRVSTLAIDTRRVLVLAAIIGPEAPVALLCQIEKTTEEAILPAIEEAIAARVLDEASDGAAVRFAHALIREAIYGQIRAIRRKIMHRTIADAMIALGGDDADAVAFHLQRGGDARAARWLIAAGERIEASYAWLAAAERYEAALAAETGTDLTPRERGWLRLRLGLMRRYSFPARALADLDAAAMLAQQCDDRALYAQILLYRGNLRCLQGDLVRGIDELAQGMRAVAASPTTTGIEATFACSAATATTMLLSWLCHAGRFAEAQAFADHLAAQGPPSAPADRSPLVRAQMAIGLAQLHAFLGHADAARDTFEMCIGTLSAHRRHLSVGTVRIYQLLYETLAYHADTPHECRRVAEAATAAWEQGHGARVNIPAAFAQAPLLFVEGAWSEAYTLAHAGHTLEMHHSLSRVVMAITLAQIAYERGEAALVHALLAEWLPDGPRTAPGTAFYALTALQRLAADMAMDTGDLPQAQAWLSAHDEWVTQSGAALGQSEGQARWARYHRMTGEPTRAEQHAQHALRAAQTPRQPLVLIEAERIAGVLATDRGAFDVAQAHLAAALALAEACAAPFEQALTLIAMAERAIAMARPREAAPLLAAARARCVPLGAQPTITRIDACAACVGKRSGRSASPYGLTKREEAIVRVLTEGLTNAEIARKLSIKKPTVGTHLQNAYRKMGVRTRTAATRRYLEARVTTGNLRPS